MNVRGERECQDCGTVWSYYDTGSVACPNCESLRSVGVGDRTQHTDGNAVLDLTEHRGRIGDADGIPDDAVNDLKVDLRKYLRKRGFVHAGTLRPIDDTYLAARELLQAVDAYHRSRDSTDHDRRYLLDLLAGADEGRRPGPEDVPEGMRAARGLAYAIAIDEFRDDLAAYLEDSPRPDAREVMGRVRDRAKRVEALQGAVDPATVETLVRATREVVDYVENDDEDALSRARQRVNDAEL